MSGQNQRMDVRRMLLARGWVADAESWTLLRKGFVSVSVSGSDVFMSGPAAHRGKAKTTVVIPDVPARAIVAMAEAWVGKVSGV